MNNDTIRYLDRATGKICCETVMGDRALRFAYETALGRTLWPVLFGGGFCSALLGKFYDSPISRNAIGALARTPGCRPDEAEKAPEEYPDFNAFFTRRLKPGARPFDTDEAVLASPADGRLMLHFACGMDEPIPVKGAQRMLAELCRVEPDGRKYDIAVIRLAPVDYHRFHYPCDCVQEHEPERIAGKYHSVNPVALLRRPDLYVENTRQIAALTSERFGAFRMIEVGAFGVGTIRQTSKPGTHRKLDEKGYFQFGGSTVILLLETGKVCFDNDLRTASEKGMEVLLRCGDSLGRAAHLM